jgi:site-specific DNA recombinase
MRIAFYIRVSSEEQAERETTKNQADYLAKRYQADIELGTTLVGSFVDEGISGTLPLAQRPAGQRLLRVVRAREVDLVVAYKVDRFARNLGVLVDIHDELARYGVSLGSATEPIDTSTPIGKAVFQLLGIFAELERDTIRDRFVLGRDRVARDGLFINGPVPLGYDLGPDYRLVPSLREIAELDGMTESELVTTLFERAAAGESAADLTLWLRARGVPSTKRYISRDGSERVQTSDEWNAVRMQKMIHAPLYKGKRELNYSGSVIRQEVPPLVDAETWAKANATLTERVNNFNRGQNDGYVYLLSGKLFCSECHSRMIGNYRRDRQRLYYVCGSARTPKERRRRDTCRVTTNWDGFKYEEAIIRQIDRCLADPAQAVAIMERDTRRRIGNADDRSARVADLQRKLADYADGDATLLGMVARKKLTEEQYDVLSAEAKAEAAAIQRELDVLENEAALASMLKARLHDAERTMWTLRAEWQAARKSGDRPALRNLIGQALERFDLGPNEIHARLVFDKPSNADNQSHYQELYLDNSDGSGAIDVGIHLNGEALEPAA